MKKRSIYNSKKSCALDFITTGISCYCLVYLKNVGILELLLQGKSIDCDVLSCAEFAEQRVAIRSALITLERVKVVERRSDAFYLTELGLSLGEYIGLIVLLFEGYGSLMAKQGEIAQHLPCKVSELLNGKSIAESSIQFGKNTVDPLVSRLLLELQSKGTLCDLGCGVGTRLTRLCRETGNPGLGFENDDQAIALARENNQPEDGLIFEKGDITEIKGVFENVVVLMQYFVFHDFVLRGDWVAMIDSYLTNFPNLDYFIYVDIVAPSKVQNGFMPGFDYVHGLQGIETPTYEQMHDQFKQSQFNIKQEIPVPGLPNTFLWVLIPKKGCSD